MMYKKLIETLNQIKANTHEINASKEIRNEIALLPTVKKMETRLDEYNDRAQHETLLGLRNNLLKVNATTLAIKIAFTEFVKIWNTYAGKHYGEATKKKISEALKTKCNFSGYVSNPYGVSYQISFMLIDPETGYASYAFNYKDVCITIYNSDCNILENNVIQTIRDELITKKLENLQYFEDIDGTIYKMLQASAKIEALKKEISEVCAEYNKYCGSLDIVSIYHLNNNYTRYKLTGSSELEILVAASIVKEAEEKADSKLIYA